MLIAIILVGLLYALPNLYGEDPAIQITASRGSTTETALQDRVIGMLKSNQIKSKSIVFENNSVLVRLSDNDEQLKAKDILIKELGDNYIVALNLAPATPHWLTLFGAEPMKLGLDLRGGVHFLMEVDMAMVTDKLYEQTMESLTSEFQSNKVFDSSSPTIRKMGNDKIFIDFSNNTERSKAANYLSMYRQDLDFSNNTDNSMTVFVTPERIKQAKVAALDQNINILRNRVNQLGVAEPVVQRQGADRIIIELPGVQDTALAKEILGATATLEFRMVNTSDNVDLQAILNNQARVPFDSELKYTRAQYPILLYKRVVLTGDHITDANSRVNQYGQPEVNISLDGPGGEKIFTVSRNNIDKQMATLFVEYRDNGKKDENGKTVLEKHEEVINVATIRSELGNRFQISGIGSTAEARQLSLLLRAGALIAPIQIVEERTIGPSLGQQNIDQGLTSSLWGLFLTVAFMLIVYKLFGVFASLALLVNLVLIVGAMSLLPGATLTMPGIAGIVLTVGMAVDANVLINERIKEELRNGRGVQQAISEGYSGAWNSIFDANITTLITAAILYAVGVGSIKGFALTLAIGVLTSMFTSIVGTRALVNLVYGNRRVNKLSI